MNEISISVQDISQFAQKMIDERNYWNGGYIPGKIEMQLRRHVEGQLNQNFFLSNYTIHTLLPLIAERRQLKFKDSDCPYDWAINLGGLGYFKDNEPNAFFRFKMSVNLFLTELRMRFFYLMVKEINDWIRKEIQKQQAQAHLCECA